jgi:RHS repeat-associated protein
VTGTRSYSGFGEITSESGTGLDRYAYTAREWDSAAGLQYSRARMYDPKLGRWTSEDPIGFAAGDANLHRYVGNGPTGASDPSGLARVPNPGHVAERTIDDSRPEDRRPRDRSLKNTRDEWWKWINPLKWVGRGIQIVGRQVAEYDDANGMHRVGDMVSGITRAMGGTIETLADFDGKTAVDMVKHTGGRAIGTAKALVSQGVYNPGANFFFVNGFVAADIIGVIPVMEGITGKDAVTGAALEGDERWERGSGAVQVVTTAVTIGTMVGGPRVPRGANPVPNDLHGPNVPKPKLDRHGVQRMVPDEGVKPPETPTPGQTRPANPLDPSRTALVPKTILDIAREIAKQEATKPKNARPATFSVAQPQDGGPPIVGRGSVSTRPIKPNPEVEVILERRGRLPGDPDHTPGTCSEVDVINQAVEQGRTLDGARIVTVEVRPQEHPKAGFFKPACPYCQTILDVIRVIHYPWFPG